MDEKIIYPIGRLRLSENPSIEEWNNCLSSIETFPGRLKHFISPLSTDQLLHTYRPGAWNMSHLCHHIADSHMNAYIRTKWILTEDVPVIKNYDENAWDKLSDAELLSCKVSLDLLETVHTRWLCLLKNEGVHNRHRMCYHPEAKRMFSLAQHIAMYAWHGDHHLAQMTYYAQRMNW